MTPASGPAPGREVPGQDACWCEELGAGRLGVRCRVDGCGWSEVTLEEQDGEVVAEVRSGHVSAHLVEQGVEGLLRRAAGELRGDVEEWEELPPSVARLAEPVDVEQEPVTRLPGDGDLLEVVPDPSGGPGVRRGRWRLRTW